MPPKTNTPKANNPPTPGPTPQGKNPQGNTPKGNTPKSNTPKSNTPKSNTPKGNTPKSNTPKGNTPKVNNLPTPDPTPHKPNPQTTGPVTQVNPTAKKPKPAKVTKPPRVAPGKVTKPVPDRTFETDLTRVTKTDPAALLKWIGKESYKNKVMQITDSQSNRKKREIEDERVAPWGECWWADHSPMWDNGETRFTQTVKSNEIKAMMDRDPESGAHASRPDPSKLSRASIFALPKWTDDAAMDAIFKQAQRNQWAEDVFNTAMGTTLIDDMNDPCFDIEEQEFSTGHFGTKKQVWAEDTIEALDQAHSMVNDKNGVQKKVGIDSQFRGHDRLKSDLGLALEMWMYRESVLGKKDPHAKAQAKAVRKFKKAREDALYKGPY